MHEQGLSFVGFDANRCIMLEALWACQAICTEHPRHLGPEAQSGCPRMRAPGVVSEDGTNILRDVKELCKGQPLCYSVFRSVAGAISLLWRFDALAPVDLCPGAFFCPGISRTVIRQRGRSLS